MALKRAQLDVPAVVDLYQRLVAAVEWKPDDPRVPALADHVAALLDSFDCEDGETVPVDDDLVELLDSVFSDSLPIAARLLRLLEDRGRSGWTRLERVGRASQQHQPTAASVVRRAEQ